MQKPAAWRAAQQRQPLCRDVREGRDTAGVDLQRAPLVRRQCDQPLLRRHENKDLKLADGSLTIYVQADAPTDPDQHANWLPAPKERFVLMMRLYWPKEQAPSIIDGWWKPPGEKVVGK